MKVMTKYPVYIDNERVGEADNQWLYANDDKGANKGKFWEKVKEGLGKANEAGVTDAAFNLLKLVGKGKQGQPQGPTPEQIAAEMKRQEELRKEEERKKRNRTFLIVGGVVVVGVIIAAVLLSRKKAAPVATSAA